MHGHDEAGYLAMLQNILGHSRYRTDRGEEGRYESFGQYLQCNLNQGRIPLLTTKKMQYKSLMVEMLWFLRGFSNVKFLHDNGVHIWDTWANDDGDVGPLYGYMWRYWRGDDGRTYDQLRSVLNGLRHRPEARSHVLTAWRPDWLTSQSIKPCHIIVQFYVYDGDLEVAVYQRSCDAFLGVPFNLAQYGFLAHLVGHHLGYRASRLHWFGGDVHIYENHVTQINKQLAREILPEPRLYIGKYRDNIDEYEFNDVRLIDYAHHGALPASISPQGRPGLGKTMGVGS